MIPFPPQEKEDQQKKDISAVQFSQPQFAQQAGQPAGAFGAQQGVYPLQSESNETRVK